MKIESDNAGAKTLHVKAASGQTEDIVDVQANDGTSYFKIDNAGNLSASMTVGIQFVLDGGGAPISAGTKGTVEVPFAGNITGWTITSDITGSIVVDVKRSTYSGFPTTSSIAGTEKPTLSGARKNQDLSLSSWTTALAAGDWLEFYVDSASNVTKVTVSLRLTRSV